MAYSRSSTAIDIAKHFGETNKTFLVTGGYSGIGVETVKALLTIKATVIVAGRNQKVLDSFEEDMKKMFPEQTIHSIRLDLGDLESVKAAAAAVQELGHLDVLINNAGVMNSPQGVTAQGHEMQFGINCVGTFLLSKLLLPMIQESSGRIVFLSSVAHAIHGAARLNLQYYRDYTSSSSYNGWVQYQQSKLGDLLLGKAFHVVFGVESCSVHPGFIQTNLTRTSSLWSKISFAFRNLGKMESYKSPAQGAGTTIVAALMPELPNGAYFADTVVKQPHPCATHDEDVQDLVDYLEEITAAYQ